MAKRPGDDAPRLGDRLFVAWQCLLPTRLVSQTLFGITQSRQPWLRNALIAGFLKLYEIDLTEAEHREPGAYATFAALFARGLRPGARPMPARPEMLGSPVDGTVSQCGALDGGLLIQAKGHRYSAAELLGDPALAAEFDGGSFVTIYLAPHNYHRIHMPAGGALRTWNHVPGRLFSVNPSTVRALPGLFVRNERVCALFDTAYGPLALVMVGALCVGSIETVWAGRVTPPHRRGATFWRNPPGKVVLERGAEAGRFNFGSTVILLLPPGAARFLARCAPGTHVRMGEALAELAPRASQPESPERRQQA